MIGSSQARIDTGDAGDVSWRTLRTLAGYDHGTHIIDFASSGSFNATYLGMVPSSYRQWNDRCGDTNGGVRLDCETGEVMGQQRMETLLGACNDGITRIRWIVHMARSIEIWYDMTHKGTL